MLTRTVKTARSCLEFPSTDSTTVLRQPQGIPKKAKT